MQAAEFEALKEKIALPDIDKHLVPLMLYRGSQSLGRMSRLWNFAITCMESEVETYSQAIKLAHNPDFAHLAGPHRPVQMSTMPGLFGRLQDNPFVTNNIPGLTEWVRSVRGWKMQLTQISIYTNDPYHRSRFSPWRIPDYRPEVKAEKDAKREKKREARLAALEEKSRQKLAEKMANRRPQEKLFYPYLAYRPGVPGDEAELVLSVNAAVPKNLPDWLRADICQDLIVGILSGEIDRGALQEPVREVTRKVFAMHPLKYGPLSLDAPVFEDGATTFLDSLAMRAH